MNRKFKRTAFWEIEIFCNIINVFAINYKQFNASVQNRSINFFFFKSCLSILLNDNTENSMTAKNSALPSQENKMSF